MISCSRSRRVSARSWTRRQTGGLLIPSSVILICTMTLWAGLWWLIGPLSMLAGRLGRTVGRWADGAAITVVRIRPAVDPSAGELLVVGDQPGDALEQPERPGMGTRAVHRAVRIERAGDSDERSGGGIKDHG